MAFNSYMHERNIYRNQPDFTQIALDFPLFRQYAIPDAKGKKVRVDFSNPDALRMVTEILLKKDFNLDVKVPQGFLIPTIPQRLNYILWLEDLLCNISQTKEYISGIDIGTGPCAIFSLLGAQKNGWKFIATESSDVAIPWAEKNIKKNDLNDRIRVVKVSQGSTLSEILSLNKESYEFCLCNPPFFENIDEIRKKHPYSNETIADVAQKEEIFFKGGELNFVKNILNDSLIYKDRICLFTSMFGKKKNFLQILNEIKELKDAKVTTTEFCQGNTVRWGIAWTFNESVEFEEVNKKIKPKKAKPPLEYQIPLVNSKHFNLDILLERAKDFLKSLQIPITVTRSSKYFAELLLKSDENTWTHQRRKRRELERLKKEANDLENKISAVFKENICAPIPTNLSVENSIHLKGAHTSENIHICIETETVSELCEVDSQTVTPENHKINAPGCLSSENNSMESESQSKILPQCSNETVCNNIVPRQNLEKNSLTGENICSSVRDHETSVNKNEADCLSSGGDRMVEICSKPISCPINIANDMCQSNKRKDFSYDDASIKKKARLDIDEKHEDVNSEPENIQVYTEIKTCTKHSKTNIQITPENHKINIPDIISSESNSEKLDSESKIFLKKTLLTEENICSLVKDHNNEMPSNKNEAEPLSFEDDKSKCDNMDKDFSNYISNPSNHSNIADDSNISQNSKLKEDNEHLSLCKHINEIDINEKMDDTSTDQGSVLHCHLQLIKRKNNIYIKMNCPPTADRNAMYQVFQLIKNKIK